MKESISKSYIGIDVSKATLDVCFDDHDTMATMPNTPDGCKSLIKQLKQYENVHVVMEATGGYERRSHRALTLSKIPVSIVNAGRVRHFAKSKSVLEKSDRIDAKIIRLYATENSPSETRLSDDISQRLDYFAKRREQLIRLRALELQHMESCDSKEILRTIKKSVQFFEKAITAAEDTLKSILQEEKFCKKADIIKSFKGCGENAIFVLLSDLPELGEIDSKAITKLAGLAPIVCDSGKYKGKRIIKGGRERVRRALYLCSLSAVQYNPQIKAMYQRLIAKGKSAKTVLIACAHKILHILNAMISKGVKWDPTHFAISC